VGAWGGLNPHRRRLARSIAGGEAGISSFFFVSSA
jgi:hypothetical protein